MVEVVSSITSCLSLLQGIFVSILYVFLMSRLIFLSLQKPVVMDIFLVLFIKKKAEKGCHAVRVKPREHITSTWASLGWAGASQPGSSWSDPHQSRSPGTIQKTLGKVTSDRARPFVI
jgi:hypothetical protein